jgi:Fe-S-cluster containining protein
MSADRPAAGADPPSGLRRYDCLACGACCFHFDVLLTGRELEEFEADPRLRQLVLRHQGPTGPLLYFMKRHADSGRCVALAGPLGNCRCTIYPQRPGLCRDFQAGAPDCLDVRKRLGFEG